MLAHFAIGHMTPSGMFRYYCSERHREGSLIIELLLHGKNKNKNSSQIRGSTGLSGLNIDKRVQMGCKSLSQEGKERVKPPGRVVQSG